MTSSFVANRIKLPLILGCVGITLLGGCVQLVQPDSANTERNFLGINKPIVFNPPPPSASCYHVKPEDTLYRIAKSHGYEDYKQLAEWNNLKVARWDGQKPVYDLYPGQVLRVTPANVTCY